MPARHDPPASDVATLLEELLRLTHLSTPDEVPSIVAEQAAKAIGARDVELYAIDYEQAALVLLGAPGAEPLDVAGTVAGRCFATTEILRVPDPGDGERLWMPVLDGTERLGVLGMSFPAPASESLVAACERYAHLVAMTMVAKALYGDAFTLARRSREMTIASELTWAMAPPLVFATEGLVVAGMLEPCYDNGGDALDYAVNGRVLHLGILDGMGHGLAAAGVTTFALAAYRHSRRAGRDLAGTYDAMDEAVGNQFPDDRYVTAIVAELDLDEGVLRWISAGHPPPVIVRGGRLVRRLVGEPLPPLGLDLGGTATVAEERLEPGDLLLLYTDGLSEAPAPGGGRLGEEGLAEFVERSAGAGLNAPETLRRLRHAVVGAERPRLRDDASALLVEWRRGGEVDLVPRTVV